MNVKIRSLEPNDFPEWLTLWDGNNQGHRNEEVTTETWSRLVNDESPVNGLCAEQNGKLLGLVHYILHPTTGYIEPVCYMQDVYVDPAHRKKGIAKKLVLKLAQIAKQEKWGRLYWLAEEKNEGAQALYKNIGIKLEFSLHIIPITAV